MGSEKETAAQRFERERLVAMERLSRIAGGIVECQQKFKADGSANWFFVYTLVDINESLAKVLGEDEPKEGVGFGTD